LKAILRCIGLKDPTLTTKKTAESVLAMLDLKESDTEVWVSGSCALSI